MSGDVSNDADTAAEAVELAGVLADRTAWSTEACPAAAALEVIGTRSALLILREALYGTTRFDDFVTRVGITEAVAAARLRELTEAGLFRRVPYREPGRRTRHEYRLTAAGSDAAPVVFALFEWGTAHLRENGRAPIDFTHRGCGAPVHVETVCDEGHRVSPGEVVGRAARGTTTAGARTASQG